MTRLDGARMSVVAGAVITGDDAGTVWEPGEVEWFGDRITYVGAPRRGPVDRRIEVGAGAVFPGFLNGHCHAAMALLRGFADDSRLMPWLRDHVWPIENRLTPDDVEAGTLLAAAEMLHAGVVGFADMYWYPQAVARAVRTAGLRGFVARGLTGGGAEGRRALDGAVQLARELAREGGLVEGWLAPHAPYTVDPDLAREVAEAARDENLHIHIHLAESREEVDDLMRTTGQSPIAWAHKMGLLVPGTLVAHGVYLTDDDVALLAESGAGVVHCPASNLKLGNGVAPILDLMKAGVPVGLGTDGPASTNRLDPFQEMRLAAWMQKSRTGDPAAFGAKDALRLATRGTAAVLGVESGVLAAGRPADLAVVGFWAPHVVPHSNPVSTLVYAAEPADVRYTVVAGRVVLDDGVITTFDESEAIRQAQVRAHRLVSGA
jgi:5-methylthioadenosine/S-adenosylhomocysteine deaminase